MEAIYTIVLTQESMDTLIAALSCKLNDRGGDEDEEALLVELNRLREAGRVLEK